MPFIRSLLLALFLTAIASADTIKVAAAISLKEALTEIGRAYTAGGGDTIEFTFGSSGQLMAQIKSGAPIDAFVSAANKQVDDLDKEGLVDASTRRVVAGNKLVLIVPAEAKVALKGFPDLLKPEVKRLAMGEPKTVPAGQYAMQSLKAMKSAEGLAERVVYGTNVRQVLDYVERGEVEAGIVYSTDARESGDKVRTVASADPATHEPIVYPAIVVKASPHAAAARKFVEHLGSDKAKAVLAAKGFTDGKAPAAAPASAPATTARAPA
ncbi:MAG: molybdate ABC transporter substrate-binding protein [Planctomycetota bacterium]|nr:molybdate ABC transporter substrate-binding protein [Planctomycetota bacterium]